MSSSMIDMQSYLNRYILYIIYLCIDDICIFTVDARDNHDMTSSNVTPSKVIVGRIPK